MAKKIRLVLLLLCVLQFARTTGAEAFEHQLSMSVKPSINDDRQKTADNKVGANGNTITSEVTTKTGTCSLEVEVSNSADQNDSCEIIVGFVGKNEETGDTALSGISRKMITVAAGGELTETFMNRFVLTEKTVGSDYNSRQTRKGETYRGYIVLLKAGGEILAQESNSSIYLKDSWITQCETASPVQQKKKK